MPKRTIFINKIKTGSKFRTIEGGARSGKKSRQYVYVTVSIHPDWAKFLPLSPFWQDAQQLIAPGSASPQEWMQTIPNITPSFPSGIQTVQPANLATFATFMFDSTIFDDDFWNYQDQGTEWID